MYKHIVVPVEIGSDDSYQIAVNAANALLEAGGKITLLHAIEPIPTYVTTYIPPEIQTKSREKVAEQLSELAETLALSDSKIIFGSAGRAIVDWAEEKDVDCIVVKSHKPEFSDIFLGSTAAWIVRHAQTNVFVLR